MTTPSRLDLDRAGLRSWPARSVEPLGPWAWRVGDGFTRRANSVAVLEPAGPELAELVQEAEQRYGAVGLPPRFQIPVIEGNAELEALLEGRGYGWVDHSLVMTMDLSSVADRPGGVDVDAVPDGAWFETWWVVDGRPHDQRPAAHRLIERLVGAEDTTAGFVSTPDRTAVGMGVVDGPLLGMASLATRPEARGRGHASAVIATLLAWGAAGGAEHAWFQVRADNQRALDLYGHLGFVGSHEYRYAERL
ncbi:MAG: GNAT family N-acetyltransferase [Actinomycetia bacterium]|nr:GNAT family N-acetyltransferase [Actinomycetes bacterium]